MKINIDDKAIQYLKKESKYTSISIGIVTKLMGWAGMEVPSVQMGKPENESSYNHYQVEDIDVYVISSLKVKDSTLTIKYRKFLWIKKLYAEGLII